MFSGDPLYEKKLAYLNLVKQLYIHDCERDENAACRAGQENNRCRFGFPKAYQAQTVIGESSAAIVDYRRRSPDQGGRFFKKKVRNSNGQETEVTIDNRHVVAHNRVLTLLMGCHVCVEWITEAAIWFYIFKYGFKADEAVKAALFVKNNENPDEPATFDVDEFNVRRELCVMGPFEACDIIRSEPWSGKSHDPQFLTVHLENEEPVYFVAGHEESARGRVENAEYRSEWTAYHHLCRVIFIKFWEFTFGNLASLNKSICFSKIQRPAGTPSPRWASTTPSTRQRARAGTADTSTATRYDSFTKHLKFRADLKCFLFSLAIDLTVEACMSL